MADQLRMFLVGDVDDNGDQRENFIAATTHQEAFELWRLVNYIDIPSAQNYAQVWVYPVPPLPASA